MEMHLERERWPLQVWISLPAQHGTTNNEDLSYLNSHFIPLFADYYNVAIQYLSYFINESRWAALTSFC